MWAEARQRSLPATSKLMALRLEFRGEGNTVPSLFTSRMGVESRRESCSLFPQNHDEAKEALTTSGPQVGQE